MIYLKIRHNFKSCNIYLKPERSFQVFIIKGLHLHCKVYICLHLLYIYIYILFSNKTQNIS